MPHTTPLQFHHVYVTDTDRSEFNRLYGLLDQIDIPSGRIRPIESNGDMGNNNEPTAQGRGRNAITLRDSSNLALRRRALSYFHGAMIAVDSLIIRDGQKREARESISLLYNTYEREHMFYSLDMLKRFGKYLKKNLKRYGIRSADIQAGEKVANLERVRPTELQAGADDHLITETPMPSRMDHPSLLDEYDFILNASHGLKNNTNYSIMNRAEMRWYNSKGWVTQQLLKAAAYLGMLCAKHGLSLKPVFQWFASIAYRMENINKAKSALATANTPKWYLKQNPVVQDYLLNHAGDATLPAIPPTLREIPGLPNMTRHESEFTATEDNAIKFHVFRHGILTPYGMTVPEERRKAAQANAAALHDAISDSVIDNFNQFWSYDAKNNPTFRDYKIHTADLSFMSPFPGMGKIGDLKRAQSSHPGSTTVFDERPNGFREDNHAMKHENKSVYLEAMHANPRFNPSSINLGINGDRWFVSKTFESEQYQDQVKATLNEFRRLERKVDAMQAIGINPFHNMISHNKYRLAVMAAEALEDMSEHFNQSFFSSSFTRSMKRSKLINAELFASCLYAIVILGMGGTVSATCKSSKDRTGLFLMHMDAIHAYFAKTGALINFKAEANSTERNQFIEILANIFAENTQQTMASQATYGALGLKEPKGVGSYLGAGLDALPADLEPAINKQVPGMFDRQVELAGMNRLKL